MSRRSVKGGMALRSERRVEEYYFFAKIQLKGVKLMYVCEILFLVIYFLPDFIEPVKYIINVIKSKRRPPSKD
ncbi:MAG: hypothetical protein FWH10_00200 [Oscillospiraceae bacterium]|nr:hypothetical protein [Oscillospiraceae bacterium]